MKIPTHNFVARIALAVTLIIPASIALAMCNPNPSEAGLTNNDREYYVSEIGGCENLSCWVDNLAGSDYSNATLIVDQACTLHDTLNLPSRMVLAGVGIDGEGSLAFHGLAYDQAGIAVVPSTNSSAVTIRDLRIAGDNPLKGRGIELDSAHQVIVERVRISEFGYGIYGRDSFSVIIDKVNLHNNNVNIFQDVTANTWRVTNSILNQAVRWGIYQKNNSKNQGLNPNSSVYANNRLESNGLGGIRIAGIGTVIQNNEFEGNGGKLTPPTAILVEPAAIDTRILSNFYSGDCPLDNGTSTEIAHDIHFFTNCP